MVQTIRILDPFRRAVGAGRRLSPPALPGALTDSVAMDPTNNRLLAPSGMRGGDRPEPGDASLDRNLAPGLGWSNGEPMRAGE